MFTWSNTPASDDRPNLRLSKSGSEVLDAEMNRNQQLLLRRYISVSPAAASWRSSVRTCPAALGRSRSRFGSRTVRQVLDFIYAFFLLFGFQPSSARARASARPLPLLVHREKKATNQSTETSAASFFPPIGEGGAFKFWFTSFSPPGEQKTKEEGGACFYRILLRQIYSFIPE